jgi:hypothetical protein
MKKVTVRMPYDKMPICQNANLSKCQSVKMPICQNAHLTRYPLVKMTRNHIFNKKKFQQVAMEFSLEAKNSFQARKTLPLPRPLLHRRRQRRFHRRNDETVRRRRVRRQKRKARCRFYFSFVTDIEA